MQLETASGSDRFTLAMSPIECKEVHAMAKFAQAGIHYDCAASYGMQVFSCQDSVWPPQIEGDPELRAAFAGIDRLQPQTKDGEAVRLTHSRSEMRKLLFVL